ncbi:hypothetical protein LINPERPRIM_LOCUS36545 [Linum perenne]
MSFVYKSVKVHFVRRVRKLITAIACAEIYNPALASSTRL